LPSQEAQRLRSELAVVQASHAEAEAAARVQLEQLEATIAETERTTSEREAQLRAAVASAHGELASLQSSAGQLRSRLAAQENAIATVDGLKAQLQGSFVRSVMTRTHLAPARGRQLGDEGAVSAV